MGATRRLDHYDGPGWQALFIVAGVGVLIIALGVGLQLLQLAVSIWQRKKNLVSNDPWNGRTLEWSVPSPAPFYNFAVLPVVSERDQFWETKQQITAGNVPKKPEYKDIRLPKNSGMGPIIAFFAFLIGFGLIWHIWWLAIIGIVGVIVSIIIRTSNDDTEYTLTAAELKRLDAASRKKEQYV
jgi:cytochrome o ubiquinol oxidase subunit 1